MIKAQLAKSDLQLSVLAVTTTTSARWDMSGCDYAVLDVYLGKQLNTSTAAVALNLQDADTATFATNLGTVVADASKTPGTTGQLHRYLIDTRARKRYLFLKTTPGTTTNDPVPINAVLHKFRNAADVSGTSSMVGTTNDSVTTVG